MKVYGEKKRFGKLFGTTLLLVVMAFVGMFSCGCTPKKAAEEEIPVANVKPAVEPKQEEPNKPAENKEHEDLTKMVSYDITSVGRSDPFMPSDEIEAFENARNSAISEARLKNSQIAKLKNLKLQAIREPDDVNPYSFNLPVPPTSLASSDSYAAKITRTKVVGIMFNNTNPSAILNVDGKDYLVRQGDKIIGQEYKVVQINPNCKIHI